MKNILFLVSGERTYLYDHLEGIYRYSRVRDWHVQVVERASRRKVIERAVDFWHPVGAFVEFSSVRKAENAALLGEIPVVYFDLGECKPTRKGCFVGLDSRAVGSLGADRLLALNLRNYAYAGYWNDGQWDRERGEAFVERIRTAGRAVFRFSARSDSPSVEWCRKLRAWMKTLPRPCGVLAANDLVGAEVIAAAADLGFAVPDDFPILGVDNDIRICENQVPTLSSIDPDVRSGGYLAAKLLDAKLASGAGHDRETSVFRFPPARIVARQSTSRSPLDCDLVDDALAFIRKNAASGISVSDVVARTGLGRRAVENHFRSVTGRSILEAIDDVRFERALELLGNPLQKIGAVAARCGFSTEVALRKGFRKRFGCSMRDWRQSHAERDTLG